MLAFEHGVLSLDGVTSAIMPLVRRGEVGFLKELWPIRTNCLSVSLERLRYSEKEAGGEPGPRTRRKKPLVCTKINTTSVPGISVAPVAVDGHGNLSRGAFGRGRVSGDRDQVLDVELERGVRLFVVGRSACRARLVVNDTVLDRPLLLL